MTAREMRPHAQNFYDLLFVENLTDKTVPDIDAGFGGRIQVTPVPLV